MALTLSCSQSDRRRTGTKLARLSKACGSYATLPPPYFHRTNGDSCVFETSEVVATSWTDDKPYYARHDALAYNRHSY